MFDKAISRALLEQFLTEAALMAILIDIVFDTEIINKAVFKTQLNELF